MPAVRDDDPPDGVSGPYGMFRAAELANAGRDRVVALLRSTKIPYAIAGECATAAWVSRVDESAIRNTREIHVVLSRDDSPLVIDVMENAGFPSEALPTGMIFRVSSTSKLSQDIHVYFAREKFLPEHIAPVPDVLEVNDTGEFPVLDLEVLVRLALTFHKRLDVVNLCDLIDVGLVDASWPARFQPELGARLQALLDDPDG